MSCLTAHVSSSAVRGNLALLRRHLNAGTKLCAVVKADCYGHGLSVLLPAIADAVDCVAVATPEEAIEVRRLGYAGPLLLFFSPSACPPGQVLTAAEEMVARDVILTAVSEADVPAFVGAARKVGRPAEIHVKIDTGMTRSGVPAEAAPALVERIRRESVLRLGGLYTHFAAADEADKGFTLEQLERFLAVVDSAGGRAGLTLHCANSAAAIDLPETHLDMVRVGIAMYGYQPSDSMRTALPLRAALRLTGRLMQVRDVPSGSSCGYGRTFTFDSPGRIGLVPIGYADGYLRCLSNRATMRVRGRDAPVRGRVSMDQTILDLAGVPEARVGDEVEIISPDPRAPHGVENLARLAGTIPYEITCLLGPRVRRSPTG